MCIRGCVISSLSSLGGDGFVSDSLLEGGLQMKNLWGNLYKGQPITSETTHQWM